MLIMTKTKKYYKISDLYIYCDWETRQYLMENARIYAEEEEISYIESVEIIADELELPCAYNKPINTKIKI